MFLLPISPAPVLRETTSLVVPSGLQGQGRGGRASVSRSFTSFPGWAAPGLLFQGDAAVLPTLQVVDLGFELGLCEPRTCVLTLHAT